MSGNLDERGQTCSVPQRPTGTTGAPVSRGQAGGAGVAVQDRVEEGLTAGDGPLGQHDDHLTGPQSAAAARRIGSPDPLPRSTGIPPSARASWPTTGASKTSCLARKRTGRPSRARHQGEGGDVEVAPVVGGEQHRAAGRDVLDSADVEAGIGERLGPDERADQVVRLEPEQRGDARRHGPSARAATAAPRPPRPVSDRR